MGLFDPQGRTLAAGDRTVKQSWCLGLPNGEETRAENWVGSIDDTRKQHYICPKDAPRVLCGAQQGT